MDFNELEDEWHSTKNLPLQFSSSLVMNKRYWWQCKLGHNWEDTLRNRVIKLNDCPFCSYSKVLRGFNDLATTNPDLATEWHPTKNTLTLEQVTTRTSARVWWQCKLGHNWQDTIKNRAIKGSRCFECSGKKPIIYPSRIPASEQDLATIYPSLAAEWHPTKNGSLSFSTKLGMFVKVWWLCSQQHEWKDTFKSRLQSAGGCPICSHSGINDLAATHPLLAAEWHPTKNGSLSFNTKLGMFVKVWWLCSQQHEWKDTLKNRLQAFGNGCPVCSGRETYVGINDLTTTHPSLAAEWHPTKNRANTPEQITSKSNVLAWWVCAHGHNWSATPYERTVGAIECRTCLKNKKQLLPLILDSFSDFPLLVAEFHPTKNKLSLKIKPQFTERVWWQCSLSHEWEATPYKRTTSDKGCEVCIEIAVRSELEALTAEWHPTKNKETPTNLLPRLDEKFWWLCSEGHKWEESPARRLRKGEEAGCPVCFKRRKLISEWHPLKNGSFTPENIMTDVDKRFWWVCSKGHEWEDSPKMRTRHGGFNQCPMCANLTQVRVGVNDLNTTHPEISAEWHPTKNGIVSPEHITAGVNRKFWWLGKCNHAWEAYLSNRIKGGKCSYCVGNGLLAGFNDLATINPLLAAEWHPTKNGALTPVDVRARSSVKVWWLRSSCGHEWKASVNDRANGNGCGRCWAKSYTSKAERAIHDYVCSLDAGMKVIQSERKILGRKELDIYIPDKKIAIEFNGLHWHKEKFSGRDGHYNKWLACKDKGIELIQIWEDEWIRNPNQIKRLLANKIWPSTDSALTTKSVSINLVDEIKARKFLNENHIQGYASGSSYIGLYSDQTLETLLALLVVGEEDTDDKVLNIIRYAAAVNIPDGLSSLIAYANKRYLPNSIVAITDNCGIDGSLFKEAGFSEEKICPPTYMYLTRSERKPKSDYSMERFRTDPIFEWAEGFTEEELAYLNDIERIWDAGKTRYRLIVGE